jgi:DNA-binding NtrC family response regulator
MNQASEQLEKDHRSDDDTRKGLARVSARSRIMIVDDDENVAILVRRALERPEYEFEICADGETALASIAQKGADVIISDIKMPLMNGIELLGRVRREFSSIPVILMTAQGSIPAAVTAVHDGAFSYLTHPINRVELAAVVERALRMTRLERENRHLREQVQGRFGVDSFVAVSEASRKLVNFIKRVAPSHSSVVIEGESGTGKELVAQLLHFWSDRVGQPFVAVNCKAFAEGVLESELFGHEKGAFTGAIVARAGCFERASGGTLFLDEIGDISREFQAKLLRVLQQGEVLRVGGTHPIKVDVRVIAATNRTLTKEVADGNFREDLFFRLAVIPISLLPLRERREDILPLVHHFVMRHAANTGRRLEISPAAEQALIAHSWRGNVRELENAIERAGVLSQNGRIEPEDLLLKEKEHPAATIGDAAASNEPLVTLQETLDRAASLRIAAALEIANGNRSEAARALGIDRTTLYRFLRRLSL